MKEKTDRLPVDLSDLSTRLDGDESLILTLLKVFDRNCRIQLDMLEAAMAGKDAALAARTVRAVAEASGKSSVSYVHASAVKMEKALRDGDLIAAGVFFADLKTEFENFATWIGGNPEIIPAEE